MNQHQSDQTFGDADVAPNPFINNPDHGAIPTIPGFDMGAAKKAPINLHGVLTLGILLIAAAAIWGMRSIGLKGLQASVQGSDSSALSVDPGVRPAVMTLADQHLLADLNASRTEMQVPGEELQKNPFSLSDALRPKAKAIQGAAPGKEATMEEIAAQRQAELLTALADYKLQGVMGGSNPVARINGKAYRVGDKLGDGPDGGASAPRFTVSAIEGREVTVTLEGFSFILSMDGR